MTPLSVLFELINFLLAVLKTPGDPSLPLSLCLEDLLGRSMTAECEVQNWRGFRFSFDRIKTR